MILFWWRGLMLGGAVVVAEVGGRDARFPPRQSPSATMGSSGTMIPYQITFDAPSLTLGENGTITFFTDGSGSVSHYSLTLLQLPAGDPSQAASSSKVLDVQTEICITDKDGGAGCDGDPGYRIGVHIPTTKITNFPIFIDSTTGNNLTSSEPLEHLFFCIGGPMNGTTPICNFYSSVFSLQVDGGSVVQPPSSVSFPATMTVTSSAPPILKLHDATVTADGITTTASANTTSTSLTTVTATPTSSSTSLTSTSSPSVSHSTSKLSTGAKVGIALGALAFISLLLLLALFLLRKKHSSRKQNRGPAQPEQVMLTRDMHQDSFSRNLMMLEKDRNPSSTIAGIDTPPLVSETSSPQRESTIPIQRHSIYNPSSIPPAGNVGVPRRKPTTSTILTSPSPPSPTSNIPSRSGTTGSSDTRTRTPPDTFEAYHDVPIYGDARHVPQVFNTVPERGVVGHGSASPFLSEEGMSAEEISRLEEEEARIDAAIAAAERGGAH